MHQNDKSDYLLEVEQARYAEQQVLDDEIVTNLFIELHDRFNENEYNMPILTPGTSKKHQKYLDKVLVFHETKEKMNKIDDFASIIYDFFSKIDVRPHLAKS